MLSLLIIFAIFLYNHHRVYFNIEDRAERVVYTRASTEQVMWAGTNVSEVVMNVAKRNEWYGWCGGLITCYKQI